MQVLDAEQVRAALPWTPLVEALRTGFAEPDVTAPVRHLHTVPLDGDEQASLLLMPAWRSEQVIGVKLVTVFPRNSAKGLPGVDGTFLVFDGVTGQPRAVLDGGELTVRRTAAASALAADYLARDDASTHLMVGTGRLALNLLQAHAAVRPIKRALFWGRRSEAAEARAAEARGLGFDAQAVETVAGGMAEADIVSAATNSTEALILGENLRPGIHLDLVGAYQAHMREADDAALVRADILMVDTREGAMEEAGDILQAIEAGAITVNNIAGEFADFCAERTHGRRSADQITVFKSCGAALEDLVASQLALSQHSSN